AIKGLSKQPMVDCTGLWATKNGDSKNEGSYENTQAEQHNDCLFDGISGPLWVLSEASKCNYSVDSCHETIQANVNIIIDSNPLYPTDRPGLLKGQYGVALALSNLISSGLQSPTEDILCFIKTRLSLNSQDVSYFNGISGQGIALL